MVDFITLPDACRRLGLSWSQGYRLVLVGIVRAERHGRHWALVAEDVARLQREGVGRRDPQRQDAP